MQYYHIVLDAHLEKKGKRIYILSLDDSEEKVGAMINTSK